MKASSVKSVRCAIYPGQFHSQSSSAQNQQNPHWSLTVSSNLCVAVPDGATELERLRDRNQGIAPPSNADLIAIIRAPATWAVHSDVAFSTTSSGIDPHATGVKTR